MPEEFSPVVERDGRERRAPSCPGPSRSTFPQPPSRLQSDGWTRLSRLREGERLGS